MQYKASFCTKKTPLDVIDLTEKRKKELYFRIKIVQIIYQISSKFNKLLNVKKKW